MKLSVVSTLYRSRPFLEPFLKEIRQSIARLPFDSFELIFVNDGSPDDSLDYLLQAQKQIPEIVVIDLSRNFGHHYAMQAGLSHATGDYIFLIDNDLEVSPSFLESCYERMPAGQDQLDVVYGYQEVRKGGFSEMMGGRLFWWALNKMSEVPIPANMVTERLMTRAYLDQLLRLGDANLFLGGMMHWAGFRQLGIPVKKGQREGGSTYSTRKRLALMLQAITSFSGKPLEYLFYSGLLVTLCSMGTLVFLVVQKLVYGNAIELGWTSLVAINVLILGIISTFLGLIGIYLQKVFRQVQHRPNFIIRKIY